MFAGLFEQFLVDSSSTAGGTDQTDPDLLNVYEKWNTLHPVTKRNLRKFEEPGFRLASQAKGVDEVKKLVRLSKLFADMSLLKKNSLGNSTTLFAYVGCSASSFVELRSIGR
jgi:hypothetical protein